MAEEVWMLQTKKADFKQIGARFRIDPVTARIIRNRGIEGEAALVLSRSLKIGKQLVEDGEKSAKAIKDAITAEINKEPLARIDYVDVVDFETITPVDEIKGTTLVAIAVYIGKTRLIDNFIA